MVLKRISEHMIDPTFVQKVNDHTEELVTVNGQLTDIATFRPNDTSLSIATKTMNEFTERSFNLNWYKSYATKDGSGNVTDWAPAINQVINLINSSTNTARGLGAKVLLPSGDFKIATSVSTITKSNIAFEGCGMNATRFLISINNGGSAFTFDAGTNNRIWNVKFRDLMFDGQSFDCTAIKIKSGSFCYFDNINIRNCKNHGMYFEEVWDSFLYGVIFTGCGQIANNKHALYLYNGTLDNTNRIILTTCHFEACTGSPIYSDSTGNARKNGQINIINTKFHGPDTSALPGTNPVTPHIHMDGDGFYVLACMFYQCASDFIYINGNSNKIDTCDFYNCTGNFINFVGSSTRNSVTGCVGQSFGSGKKAVEDTSTGENWVASNFTGENRKIRWNKMSIGDDGGRLAFWSNVYRSGSSKIQIDGTQSSYATSFATNDTDGISFDGATAGGTNNGVVTLTRIASFNINRLDLKKPLKFTGVSSASVGNNELFLDSADNVLKFRDNAGVVKIVNLT